MDAVIRFAADGDIADLQEVEASADEALAAFFRLDEALEAETGAERASMPGFLLVAELEGRTVGFAQVVEAEALCHLEQMSVRGSAARRGIGTALLEAALETAASRGHTEMTLRTFVEPPFNAPFYARHGFVERTPGRSGPLAEILHAERDLDRLGPRVVMGVALRAPRVPVREGAVIPRPRR
ncbi:GNAT family N-acetyltransferase [Microbacterium aquimaris]|uniref:GNAT family N-acetyltransferase n=1 Tax=Microbacterium aquimaris TaxID=459816 RepID=UPI002AD505A4|nr:GNAT family N-acetyltransferase [Microbacterium aquimaris]MDZ8276201.1 GNAT family N-acetyltransferase [Microbacterium aquimaris]